MQCVVIAFLKNVLKKTGSSENYLPKILSYFVIQYEAVFAGVSI